MQTSTSMSPCNKAALTSSWQRLVKYEWFMTKSLKVVKASCLSETFLPYI